MAMYCSFKYQSMMLYNDTNIMTSLEENWFDETYEMKGEKGNFQLAFGLVTYGDFLEDDYSAYGKLVARMKKWSATETTYFDDLDIRRCTEAELGLTENDEASLFFPIFPAHVSQVETYKKQLMCIDTPYAIKGDYSS